MLASNGCTDTSMGGGTKVLRLEQNGCAGVLTDGRLRDFDELARYDFAAYCSGEATRWGGDHLTPFQANAPVVLQGVGVVPGQFVFADSPGAVLIPDGQIDEVLAEARKVEAVGCRLSRPDRPRAGRVNDHSASSPRRCSTRGAPFTCLRASLPLDCRCLLQTNLDRLRHRQRDTRVRKGAALCHDGHGAPARRRGCRAKM